MKKILLLIAIIAVMQSCAFKSKSLMSVPCDEGLSGLVATASGEESLSIVGKARIELPRYRLRGLCMISFRPPDDMRIDFKHSSLFGSYREESTIFINGDDMTIYDHKRGHFIKGDSSIAILRESLGLEVFPDDLIYACLLAVPGCSEQSSLQVEESGDSWTLKGEWRNRDIEIKGDRDTGPVVFKQCFDGGSSCCICRYGYGRRDLAANYPCKINFEREFGMERVSIEISDVTECEFDPIRFVPEASIMHAPAAVD